MLPAFIKGMEHLPLREKGSLSTRNHVRRVKNGSEYVFSPSRFIFLSSKPLRVSLLSSARCGRLQCGKCCSSVASAAEISDAEERVRPGDSHLGQEVPGVAAVSHFGLRFRAHWSLRNAYSSLKRRRCSVSKKK